MKQSTLFQTRLSNNMISQMMYQGRYANSLRLGVKEWKKSRLMVAYILQITFTEPIELMKYKIYIVGCLSVVQLGGQYWGLDRRSIYPRLIEGRSIDYRSIDICSTTFNRLVTIGSTTYIDQSVIEIVKKNYHYTNTLNFTYFDRTSIDRPTQYHKHNKIDVTLVQGEEICVSRIFIS